jgi:glycosyltransferase involved in cell wall biosynthesis
MAEIDYIHEVQKLLAKKPTTISCVIPAFNEGPRIGKVLDVIADFPIFHEIVLVNDGSGDETLEVMKQYAKNYKKITIIDVKKNGGKTQAVLKGVRKARGEMICLVDADLTGLKFEYLYKMIYFLLTGEFDQTILDREGERVSPIGWVHSWTSRFNGGERAFWKKDFKKIKFDKKSLYGIEQIINLYYVKNGLKVRTIWCPGLYGALQFQKKGFLKGLAVYNKMHAEIYRYGRVKGFYAQVENIVEDRIEPLYKLKDKTVHKKTAMGAIIAAGLLTSVTAFVYLNLRRVASRRK